MNDRSVVADDSQCYHCGLPLPEPPFEEAIESLPRQFCCIGCQSVCKAIYDAGLEGFYQRTPDGTLLAPPPPPPQDSALYDLDDVQSEFVTTLGDSRDIHLLVEGIHCAACVWLIEHTLSRVTGVVEAKVNLAGKRLHLRWDNSAIPLSKIIDRLAQVGYKAVPYDPENAEGALAKQNRSLLYRMAFAGFTMMNLLWISIALYSGADQGEFRGMFHWIGFALATPTLLYSGWPFLKGAWTGLRSLHLTMDLPIAIGASTTYSYSLYVMLSQSSVGEVYYDTVVNFIFVILVGRYLEAISKKQAVSSTQRLLDLQPRVATLLRDGEPHIVPIRTVKPGEIVLVKAGDKIPVDGTIIDGRSRVDESMLSGESEPVAKLIGDSVSAGTVNIESALTLNIEGTLKDTALGRIIRLVEDAQASKAPIQCVADRIVPWFVAITLLLASLTFAFWHSTDFEIALMAATAVLIITCPCAFGLATPMAIAVASGLGARYGILVKNGAVLETLSDIDHFIFDKTGTLTEGRMGLVKVVSYGNIDDQQLLGLAARVERFSEHTTARAIVAAADELELNTPGETSDFESKPGFGVRARVDGIEVMLGTEAWLTEADIEMGETFSNQIEQLEGDGVTCIHIAVGGKLLGFIALADRLRPDAATLIENLRQSGAHLTLLSGDRQRVAEAIAKQLGGMEVIAEVLPQDKDRVIQELQQQGAQVAMIGDGVNDAPALIRADVGIAVGSGTDVSMESADIVLISSELEKVALASRLSRRTLRTIRQNIGISITYNVIMVPLAMMAFVTPLVAAVSMPISSLLVIGNAARIRTLFKGLTSKR
ncbi:copper-translocating P-type ATPase [Solemya pervernicosa gill symbiont]|uniref:Copper-translocating P-type ATPase n=2 Tax=Gammaproteobacteria incertae sedis TaxID=118884 RepID=A0A1T2L7G4_9GAMM|nr:heavy metal translocating P-type ATPase [Candidatus Reidiella endopervernicosa]OOZ40974.1 copper-translocating P-type ATPase [Solemya pervernicosa gill symbiont]QKQ25023.1 heavy metal translocating P-type ATPase [Candidatus Reidiella endopervernicosa]